MMAFSRTIWIKMVKIIAVIALIFLFTACKRDICPCHNMVKMIHHTVLLIK